MSFKDKIDEMMEQAIYAALEEKKLDPVNKKALDKDFDDREDKDIDNDGDVDSSDEYLHNRRKAIKKAMAKESIELDEEELDEISAKLARSARDKAKASELDYKIKAYDKISKTKDIPIISKIGKKAAEPDIKMADRRKRQANLANRKLGGMGDYEYDGKGKYRRQGPAKVLAKEEVELDENISVRLFAALGGMSAKDVADAFLQAANIKAKSWGIDKDESYRTFITKAKIELAKGKTVGQVVDIMKKLEATMISMKK